MNRKAASLPGAWLGRTVFQTVHFLGWVLFGLVASVSAESLSGNDQFADATVIVDSAIGSNVGATKEWGEPKIAGNPGGKSVWWKWIAPAGGIVTITTAGSDFDTLLGVFTGNNVAGLTPIAANDDADEISPASRVTFECAAGTIYSIAVDGFNAGSGFVRLDLHLAPAEPGPCSYSLSPAGASFPSDGGSGTLSVRADAPGCVWAVSGVPDWISIDSGTGQAGSSTLHYTVAANLSPAPRAATLTVGQQTMTIAQVGDILPAVTVTAPAGGMTVNGTIDLVASTSQPELPAVQSVEFYRDGDTLVASSAVSPYSATYDTTTLANGSHTFYAKAYDLAGNWSTSPRVAVTVSNAGAAAGGAGRVEWVRQMRSESVLMPNALAVDHDHQVLVAGACSDANGSTANLGGGPWQPISSSPGFLAKYSAENELVWALPVGNGVTAVAVDRGNNVIVTGYFYGSADFEDVTLRTTSSSDHDIFVAKFSSTGRLIWVRQFGASDMDFGSALAVDSSDNVLVAAKYSGQVNFGTGPLRYVGDFDIALVKLSGTTAQTLWAKSLGSAGYDVVNQMAVDRADDVVLTGRAGRAGHGDTASIDHGGILVAKCAGSDGEWRWLKVFPSGSNRDSGNGIATDPNTGSVYVAGGFSGTVDLGGGAVLPRHGGGTFLAAYDSSGNYLWADTFGGEGDFATAVSVDGTGKLVLAGLTGYPLDFATTTLPSGDAFVAGFEIGGSSVPVCRWAFGLTGAGINGLALDPGGHMVAAGSFRGTARIGGSPLATATPGAVQGFVVRYKD